MAALIYLAILAVVFFVLVVRPQRRQMAAHRALVASIQVGDEIVSSGGVYGTVRRVDDASVDVEVAQGVTLKLAREAITRRVVPTPPPSTD